MVWTPIYVDSMGRCFMMYDGATVTSGEGVNVRFSDASQPVDGTYYDTNHHVQGYEAHYNDTGYYPSGMDVHYSEVEYNANDNVVPPDSVTPHADMGYSGFYYHEDQHYSMGSSAYHERSATVQVIQEYIPTVPDELPLEVGQIVHISYIYHDGWAMGSVESYGKLRRGVFPLCFTTFQHEGAASGKLAKRNQSLKK
jgi:hypothetical protein